MPEKKFEKELQEDMGGLRFRPSDAVWQHIETSLRREKRRKRAIYFFTFIGLLLLGGGSYLAFDTGKYSSALADKPGSVTSTLPDANTEQQSHHSSKRPISANDKIKVDETPATTTVKPDPALKGSNIISETATGSQASASQREDRKSPTVAASEPRNKNRRGVSSKKINAVTPFSNPGAATDDAFENTTSSDTQHPRPETAAAEKQYRYIDPAASNVYGFDAVRNSIAKQLQRDELDPSPGAVAATEYPLKKSGTVREGWEWSVVAGGGINDHVDELPRLVKSRADNMPAFSNSPQPGPAVNPVMPPSEIRSGMALKFGINAAYPLTERTRISAGIAYAYMTTLMRVGTRYNDPVNFDSYTQQPVATNVVYRGPQDKSYTNQYHFVQLPLTFEAQLNRSKTTRISWSGSLVPGYMISGSPLLYDTAFNGIYYENKDGFKRFRLGVATGMHVAFGKPGKLQWSIGPEFYIDLRSITKPSFGTRQYFINSGLTARFILPSRKK